jgi:hypothetical protein
LWRVRAGGHLTVKLFKVESNLFRMPAEISIAKFVWMEVEKPVHLPELPLRGGSLGGFGRSQCIWMHFDEGKVAVDKSDRVLQLFDNLLDLAMPALTIRTLIVTVVNDGHSCAGRAEHMVAIAHGNRER